MNELFEGQADQVDAGQKASAERWQQRDRYYEQVQAAAVHDENATDESLQVMNDLQDMAIALPEDVEVWRGVRSIEETFGTGIDGLIGRDDEIVRRFMSTTVHKNVARGEFTRPSKSPALLKVTAHAGAAAVWMPPIGDPEMAYQGELLFRPGCLLRILAVDTSADVPVIEVEVSQP